MRCNICKKGIKKDQHFRTEEIDRMHKIAWHED